MLTAGLVKCETYYFAQPNGDWNDYANWLDPFGENPTSSFTFSDSAILPPLVTVYAQSGVSYQIGSLFVNDSATLKINGEMVVEANFSAETGSTLEFGNGGSLQLNGPNTIIDGAIIAQSGGQPTITTSYIILISGSIYVSQNTNLAFQGFSTLMASNNISVTFNSTVSFSGSLVQFSGSVAGGGKVELASISPQTWTISSLSLGKFFSFLIFTGFHGSKN